MYILSMTCTKTCLYSNMVLVSTLKGVTIPTPSGAQPSQGATIPRSRPHPRARHPLESCVGRSAAWLTCWPERTVVPAGPAGAVAVGGSEKANTQEMRMTDWNYKSTSKRLQLFLTKCILLEGLELIFHKCHKQNISACEISLYCCPQTEWRRLCLQLCLSVHWGQGGVCTELCLPSCTGLLDMFKCVWRVYNEACYIGNAVVGIRLKCLLVLIRIMNDFLPN